MAGGQGQGQGQGGSRGGSSGQRFYNDNVDIGGTPVSIATIILGGVVIFGMFGGSFASGLMSAYGFALALFAVITWLVWSVRKDGVFSVANQVLVMVVAMLSFIWFFYSFVPAQFNKVDMTEWDRVFDSFNANVNMNSPLSNPPIQGIELPTFDTTISSNNPTNGGAVPVYSTPTQGQVIATPLPYIEPTVNPMAAKERELLQAYNSGEGQRVLLISEQILLNDPTSTNALIMYDEATKDLEHSNGLFNMPKARGMLDAGLSDSDRQNAFQLLSGGYDYIVLDNGDGFSTFACSESLTFQLTSGLFAGGDYVTQRCAITKLTGSSNVGHIWTSR